MWSGVVIVEFGLWFQDPDSSLAEAEVCDLDSMEWRRISTRGQIPILGKGTVCGMYGCHVFVFSGLDDEDYRNDLYRLDLERLVWRKMPVHGVPPCPRSYGGMVVHGDCLIVFGGIGKPLKASGLPSSDLGGEVIKDTKFGGEFESEWNNYIHEYSTISGIDTPFIVGLERLFVFYFLFFWLKL